MREFANDFSQKNQPEFSAKIRLTDNAHPACIADDYQFATAFDHVKATFAYLGLKSLAPNLALHPPGRATHDATGSRRLGREYIVDPAVGIETLKCQFY